MNNIISRCNKIIKNIFKLFQYQLKKKSLDPITRPEFLYDVLHAMIIVQLMKMERQFFNECFHNSQYPIINIKLHIIVVLPKSFQMIYCLS